MLLPLPTPSEMVTWDRETIETIGIPGVTLMESASREAVAVLLEEYGSVKKREVFCFAGAGNNGGDGFAMARQLIDLGADVTVFHTKPQKSYRGETRTNLLWAQKLGVPLKHLAGIDLNSLPQPDIIIDGLLGTGFQGELRTDYLELVRTINRLGKRCFVFSIDIPSGLNGLTGEVTTEAVVADVTATFQAAKLGLVMPDAKRFTGMVHVRSIGIPNKIQQDNPVHHHLISAEVMDTIPGLSSEMHKGTAGHVLVIGGSPGLTGAPMLAAKAALRSGAGLTTIGCPDRLVDTIKAGNVDVMIMPIGKSDRWSVKSTEAILNDIGRFDSVVLGPGLGRGGKTVDFLKSFVADCPSPLVLDADALHGVAQCQNLLASLVETTILTPHPGEMATLLNVSNKEIQADRLGAITELAKRTNATVILKGAGTLIANKDMTCLSPFSEPNLAVGGSGDVLSGVIGSLLARGMAPMNAACLGVYWHGLTGRLLRDEFPARGNLASDIANTLPKAAQHAKEFSSC